MYASLEEIVQSAAETVRAPERLTVAQASERYRYLHNPGSYTGPWRNAVTPYLVEPMETMTSLQHTGLVFVASAQSGKTDAGLNWILYTAICDPSDFMLVQTTQTQARHFSMTRIDKMLRDSPEFRKRLRPGKSSDNRYDKTFRSGAVLSLSWPTVNELAGKPVPKVFLTDYDRMDQDVGGDGAPFDLGAARTTTFGRYGMTVAESSPSFPVIDPRWTPATPHEAPPTEGILGLYNRGDRRRWYWKCVKCERAFEPDFRLMNWPESDDILEAAEKSWLECPHCRTAYFHDPGDLPGKHQMNEKGFWLKDGERMLRNGSIAGTPSRSLIASFWLKGTASAFKDWTTLVSNYLQAQRQYDRTGAEEALKTTVNVDQAMPYLSKELESERLPELLKERASDFGHQVVPEDVRFMVASVDVQKSRFVVQVHGVSQGGDLWVIDRFSIRYSLRLDPDRDDQFFVVRPFTYREDWRLLLREVLRLSYPLIDDSGRRMSIKAVISDSGGLNEATANAYAFWRWLKNGPDENDEDAEEWEEEWTPGLHNRFVLFKGDVKTDVRTRVSFPDSSRKDRHAGARGEIPVLLVNTNAVKNQIDSMLDRENLGTGKINFPNWLGLDFYKELCVETKDIKGQWVNPRNFKNESWDLLVMAQALLIERRHIGIETIDWGDPPGWACEWDENPLVFEKDGESILESQREGPGLEQLAEILG